MCSPISLILSEDNVFLPPNNCWNHSHTVIAKNHNLPNGLIGDKYARIEVTPKDNIFRNPETNEVLEVDDTWEVILDEERMLEWYSSDLANHKNRAFEAAKRWLKNFDKKYLIPGHKEIGGYRSTLTGGDFSTLTGGYNSTLTGGNDSKLTGGNFSNLTGGNDSKLTGGNFSKLTGGNFSKLTGGNFSTLTGGNCSTLTSENGSTLTGGKHSTLTGGKHSIFCADENSSFTSRYWDNKRYRTVTFYVGEDNILPNKKYKILNDKIYDAETGKEVNKVKKNTKKKSEKKK